MKDKIINSINSGISYLITSQQKDGSFLSLSSPNPQNFDKALKFHSTFSTALILTCLNNLEETPKIKLIKQKCASFLLSQKSKHWSFNYWVRNSKEAKKMPYPDDLDDTFCILSALYQYDADLFDGQVMAAIVTLLTAVETQEGGPYRTWLVDDNAPKIWRDTDLAVNSNIAYFLSLQEISLPNLNKFIASRVIQKKISSPYYPNLYPIIYFIARVFKKNWKYKAILQKILLKRQKNGFWENPLYTALNVSSLFHLGTNYQKLSSVITYLISQQHPKGYWSAYAFCLDPASGGQSYFSGSSSLTTAFCLEALQHYLTLSQQSNMSKIKTTQSKFDKSELIYRQIIKNINKRLSKLDTQLKAQALNSLETALQKENKKQVALLPYFFKLAVVKKGENLKDKFIIELGMANLYGWIAYTIYDNFLDDEGNPKNLSVANLALRELTNIFTTILPNTKFDQFFNQIMDQLDDANTWEVTNCRVKISKGSLNLENFTIPDYGDFTKLAQRSIGHALTPMAILYCLGFNEKSKEVKSLYQFFTHYLIARQLSDDAHDWEKDLKMGHINAVGALLLKQHPIKTATTISSLIPKLQEMFWHQVIVKVSNQILTHTKIARKYLSQCSLILDQSLTDRLLEKYEKGARLALKEQSDALKFLASYQL